MRTLVNSEVGMFPYRLVVFLLLPLTSAWTFTAKVSAEELVSPNSNLPALLEWNFEGETFDAEQKGALQVLPTGPNGKLFEGQPEVNRALELERRGAYLRIGDDSDHGPLDFQLGESLTLEAWVRVDALAGGSYAYILGKGRTYESGPLENHNYALRLTGAGALAKISFLFSTERPDGSLQYHRWTGNQGFDLDGNWHHVAVSYTFGQPSSIVGYVDGSTTPGKWDMGGETKLAPTVDNDALWIGSSRGGSEGNSLLGAVDDVRIHRQLLSANQIKSRRILIPQVPVWPETAREHEVTITLHEGAPSHTAFPLSIGEETMRITLPKLALHRLPVKMLSGGVREVWNGPVLMRAFAKVGLPPGKVQLLIRSPGRARLWIDGQIVLETAARKLFPDAHQPFEVYEPDMPWLRVPQSGEHESRAWFDSGEEQHEVILESLVGAVTSRCELGETLVAARQGDAMFSLLGPIGPSESSQAVVHLVDSEFVEYRDRLEKQLAQLDRQIFEEAAAEEDAFWQQRHQAARQALQHWPQLALPSDVPPEAMIDRLITNGSGAQLDFQISDLEFLRRASLDTIGLPPSHEEIAQFLDESESTRRASALARLIADERWADHWTSYWQDVLAENPSILKPSLNNTGPFRFWIHDSLLLNKPMDRFVTELIRMEGSNYAGGPQGFGMASENDVPMAEKAHIVASAFLAVDMKCARCHDSPYHPWTQRDLFSIGAMLRHQEIQVPETSSVPVAFFDRKGHDSPITSTLHPGDIVLPEWPEEHFSDEEFGQGEVAPELLGRTDRPQERLAARITRGENRRFAETIVNRVWTRLLGWGLVSSTDDWYESEQRNPLLLEYLARDFVLSGYDLKHLARRIMSSQVYQQTAIDETQAENLAYAAPWQRRLSAEQVVDSMHAVTGTVMATEPITFDLEASQKIENFLNLGVASRAWQLASLSNERDRPSLSLPKAAAVVECLEAFGWRSSRQSPLTHRDEEANLVQPGVVANSHVATWTTRLTDQTQLTEDAIQAESPSALVDRLFMAILTRHPSEAETATFVAQLEPGFETRITEDRQSQRLPPKSRGFATWSNHFSVESNALMREIEREVAMGPRPTERLNDEWRERAEDAIWALINCPEFQLVP